MESLSAGGFLYHDHTGAYVVQYLEPHNIYIGMSNKTGEVDFKRIAPTKVNSLYRDAAEYDRSVGDYIFNLISSSDSDEYLKEYLEGVK